MDSVLPLPCQFVRFKPQGSIAIFAFGKHVRGLDVRSHQKCSGDLFSSDGHGTIIRDACFNSDGSLFATIFDDKSIRLWETSSWTLISTANLTKKPASCLITEVAGVQRLLVADKFGDVFSYDLPRLSNEKLIAGHFSIITAMALAAAGKRLISADRDEKIRISHYPNAHNIEHFLLGHTRYVSALCIVGDQAHGREFLVSGSGDGSLRLWDISSGEELGLISLIDDKYPEPAVISSISFSSREGTLAVSVERRPLVYLFSVNFSGTSPTVTLQPSLHLSPSARPLSLTFVDSTESSTLWVTGWQPSVTVFTFPNTTVSKPGTEFPTLEYSPKGSVQEGEQLLALVQISRMHKKVLGPPLKKQKRSEDAEQEEDEDDDG